MADLCVRGEYLAGISDDFTDSIRIYIFNLGRPLLVVMRKMFVCLSVFLSICFFFLSVFASPQTSIYSTNKGSSLPPCPEEPSHSPLWFGLGFCLDLTYISWLKTPYNI